MPTCECPGIFPTQVLYSAYCICSNRSRIVDFRVSQEQSESGIHFRNTSSVLQLLKHSKMPLLLPEVGHWVLHCTVQCRELRPYPEELDNNWFYPASAPALSFQQVCTCFCSISCEPIVAATVLSTLAHSLESSPDWNWEHYCQEEEEGSQIQAGSLTEAGSKG